MNGLCEFFWFFCFWCIGVVMGNVIEWVVMGIDSI